MTDLATVEALAKTFAEKRAKLSESVGGAEDELAAVRRRHLPSIRRRAAAAAEAAADLEQAVIAAKAAFDKPKTRILHGIRVGWVKSKGSIEITDADSVVALIEKRMPERFDELVKITKAPIKAALNRLSASDLRKIGVAVIDPIDEPVVKPADSAIDKIVKALLDDALSGEEEAA